MTAAPAQIWAIRPSDQEKPTHAVRRHHRHRVGWIANAIGEVISTGRFSQECPVKKGRHRRYEEARQMKRSSFDDLETLMDRIDDDPFDLPVTEEATRAFDDEDDEDDDD